MKKTYITFSYGYENDELTKILKKSIDEFSEYDLKIYTPADFSYDYEYDNPQFWKSGYGFIMKIHSCLKSLTEYDEVVWLDTDIVATEKIDKIWEYQTLLEDYPLLPKSRFANYKNNPTKQDPNLLLIHIKSLCDYFDVKNYNVNELVYLQACAMLFDKKSINFFETVLEYFKNFNSSALPNGDESIINGLLWKDKKNRNLGNIFLCSYFFHGNLSKVIELDDKKSYPELFDLEILENNFDELLFFHGTKSLIVADMLLANLRKFKKTKKLSLGEIMKNNGSDKSTKHNYTKLYSVLFDKFQNKKINLFELGIGSNCETIPWNMTSKGVPAASLNSWLEYFPFCNVYAADIDENILFNSKRIKTFYCDQLNENSIKKMWQNSILKNLEFEIMILDGVHTFEANMFFLNLSIHKLKTGGICVIEDIHKNHLDLYKNELNKLEYWFPTFEISLLELFKSSENVDDNCIMVFHKKF
jgi:hypothetical protein